MPRRRVPPLAVALLALTASTCATLPGGAARPWPAADGFFRSDLRWLGADAAYSVPLDGDRLLWLFGDTFIGDGTVRRNDAGFIRNSIGIQTGMDLRNANISFHWGEKNGAPDSFFPATSDAWLWPVHGLYRDGTLTLFFMRVVSATGGLGFALTGAAALRTDDIAGPPESWTFSTLELPDPPLRLHLLFGVAVLEDSGHVYAYCVEEGAEHGTYLLRWTAAEFDSGRLAAAEWWNGAEWAYATQLSDGPAPVFRNGATEFSVHRTSSGRFVQIQSDGFPHSEIAYRTAPRPEGPWSELRSVYRPPESDREGTLVYAAKAHPELDGPDLLVTYAANHFDPQVLLNDETLYFPRFVRLRLPE